MLSMCFIVESLEPMAKRHSFAGMEINTIPTAGARLIHPKWHERAQEALRQFFMRDAINSPNREGAKARAIWHSG